MFADRAGAESAAKAFREGLETLQAKTGRKATTRIEIIKGTPEYIAVFTVNSAKATSAELLAVIEKDLGKPPAASVADRPKRPPRKLDLNEHELELLRINFSNAVKAALGRDPVEKEWQGFEEILGTLMQTRISYNSANYAINNFARATVKEAKKHREVRGPAGLSQVRGPTQEPDETTIQYLDRLARESLERELSAEEEMFLKAYSDYHRRRSVDAPFAEMERHDPVRYRVVADGGPAGFQYPMPFGDYVDFESAQERRRFLEEEKGFTGVHVDDMTSGKSTGGGRPDSGGRPPPEWTP